MQWFDLFSVNFSDGETSFSSQNYFSQAEICYESKGYSLTKLKIAKNVLQKLFPKNLLLKFFFSVSRIVSKKRKVASYRRNNKLGVSFKMGYDESKLSFLRTSLRCHSGLAILEPQIL